MSHPHPLLRLRLHRHLAQHWFRVPILQPQPQPPRRDILLRHRRLVDVSCGRGSGDGGGGEEEGWGGSATGDGGEVAGGLEGQGEGEDEVGGGDGG